MSNLPFFLGTLAAIVHVLSGPDHLAAIGPIALNEKKKSWLVGLGWGLGHSLGMFLIGILFYFFREFIPIEAISAHSEKLVGILLIAIGLWAFYRLKSQKHHSHIHAHKDTNGNLILHSHQHTHQQSSTHTHSHSEKKFKSMYTALGIGTLHGFAGVSHIINLLPTLAFKHQHEAILYLAGFVAGTILAMITFSLILGIIGLYTDEGKKKLSYNILNIIAGTIAVCVGFFWLLTN